MKTPLKPWESAWEQKDSHKFLEFRAQNASHLQTRKLSGLSTTSVDNEGVVIVILFNYFFIT